MTWDSPRLGRSVARWYILNQKSHFGLILEGLAMDDVGIFMVILSTSLYYFMVYFMAIWYILWSFGIFFPV
jgi:hypothetical protein